MPKSKSKAAVSAASRPPRSRYADPVVRFYSGQVGAFRLADSATEPTALYPMVEDIAISANSSGDAAFGFYPQLTASQQNQTITAGNLGAWTGTAHPQSTTLTNNALVARMTGWRITVRYVGPEQTASGSMYVAPSSAFTLNMISSGMSNYTPQMRQYQLGAGRSWVFYVPMLGTPDFQRLNVTDWMQAYWSGMVFFFRGLPASGVGVLNIRSERSVEYQPEPSSVGVVDAEPEPYDPVQVAESGTLSGTAALEGDDQGSGWAQSVGRAVWDSIKAVTPEAARMARDVVREHLGARRLQMLNA